ncbi:MAG TPA: EamA family transporter RarD [Myxococcota bacterium]|nr:EamA family transporter RarD [Myxococcota bacterium]
MGAGYAAAAYTWWGVMPAYWKLLASISPLEVVAHRVLWSLVFTVPLLLWLGRASELRRVLADRRRRWALLASGALIGLNWGMFIWAVGAGRIVEASFGYFLNPLVSIALGVALLGERMRRAQLVAVFLAIAGVCVLGFGSGTAPWLPLALAATFALYGLLRKVTLVSSLVGLTIETSLIAPLALGTLAFLARSGESHFGADARVTALLACSGVLTALPLLWFARAARSLPLSTLGFFQYLAPTLSALLAVIRYGESFDHVRGAALLFIWAGILVYSMDSLRSDRVEPAPVSVAPSAVPPK